MSKGTYEKLTVKEAPRRKRRSVSRMEALPQWQLMREDLEKHKMTPNEVRQITVTPEDRDKYRIQSRRTMTRFVAKYLQDSQMPYRVNSFNRDGVVFIQVLHSRKRKKK